MAFIPSDGTGLTNATSYVSIAYADDYFTYINYQASWFELATIDRERALMNGTQFTDSQYIYIGYKSSEVQALQWPRTDAIDNNGYEITGIPKNLQQATCEAAIRTLNSTLYTDINTKGNIKLEKVDVIEVEYFEGTTTTNPYTIIDQLLYSAGLAIGNTGNTIGTLKNIRI
jgi:hypothetical protein